MDLSESFVLAAKRKCSRKDANFCVASITSLPYADSSVDVVIIPFVLHHLPFPLSLGLKEALRVAAKYVVVFDHISSDESPVMKAIQELYWRLFDGGHQYLGGAEWKVILDGLSVVRNLRTGAIGGHVCKFIIEKQVSK
jgi:ubiquinone/menaquinone biosynthesis C-methylase UbiE